MKHVLKFSGGPLDGQTVSEQEMKNYLFLTDDGRVGTRFSTIAADFEALAGLDLQALAAGIQPVRKQQHSYEITENTEQEGCRLVRARYLGTENPK